MERSVRVLGNITFCRRGKNWYIRYFAFDQHLRSAGKLKSNKTSENFLKKQVDGIFKMAFEGAFGEPVDSFYAYIDPKNVRSLWMGEQFGFDQISTIITQSFSQPNPLNSNRVKQISDWELIKQRVHKAFSDYQYYFDAQTSKGPWYVIESEDGAIIASAKITTASWKIDRLPGKMGGAIVKMIPYIPIINKLINPKKHDFIVVDAVTADGNDSKLVEELFAGILHEEQKKLILWWVDENDNLYSAIRKKVKWGLLNKFIGTPEAHVLCKQNPEAKKNDSNNPVFTAGIDFI